MNLESIIASAKEHGASDLHLEPGLPMALRVRGIVRAVGEPVPARELNEAARTLLGEDPWRRFVERGSADLSRTIRGTRCRINVLRTTRGVGFAIRLLAS